jgi:hypothetical protein
MHRILNIEKAKAISLVTTIPCTAGDVTFTATPWNPELVDFHLDE